jgi:hypothetical protein
MDDDCWLPGIARPISPLSQTATLSGMGECGALIDGLDRDREAEKHAWEAPLERPVEFLWDAPVNLAGARLVFDSNLANSKVMPCSYPQKGGEHRLPSSLIKAFRLETLDPNGQWSVAYRNQNNRQRLVKAPINKLVRGLRLVPESTWGAAGARVFAFEPMESLGAMIPQTPQGPQWSEVISLLNDADVAPPENGLETRTEPVFAA